VLALSGRITAAPEVITLDSKWAKVETLRRHVRVAIDGEVARLASPLVYSTRPLALKVLVPPQQSGDSEKR
jgi:diacylglycerol kinase family enzyme